MMASGKLQNLLLSALLVSITLTAGCMKTVPDVVGQPLDGAIAGITGAGLTLGAVMEAYSATVMRGMTVSQTPAGGTAAAQGSSVSLTLSQGPSPLAVPNVLGMAQAAASAVITGEKLTLGVVTQMYSTTIEPGAVIGQVPVPGTSAIPGSTVFLIVSEGPPPVTVPNVTGQTEAEARSLLAAANLNMGPVTRQCSDTVAAGLVISQTPVAGEQAPHASTVAVVLSTGDPCPETIMLPGDVPLIMVWVSGGNFMMGRYPGEQESLLTESPQHQVALGGFWMGKYELTKRQWTAVMGSAPWTGQPSVLADLDSPAVYVSWDDAQSFLTALNSYTSRSFHLPTEAQWEYACRGGMTARFYWGDDPDHTAIGDYVWYRGNAWSAGQQYAHVVGQKLPNSFGLYDMNGNVWEWCEDDGHDDYTNAPQSGQAWVDSPRGRWREVRGGGWYLDPRSCRSASRAYSEPDNRGKGGIGFRVLRTP